MRKSCHRRNAYRSDLFQPLPPTPTWDSLSLPVVRKVIEVLDLSGADVVAVYLPPRLLERLLPQLTKLKPGARIVSHYFEIPGYKPDQVATVDCKEDGNRHTVYLWTAPLKKGK